MHDAIDQRPDRVLTKNLPGRGLHTRVRARVALLGAARCCAHHNSKAGDQTEHHGRSEVVSEEQGESPAGGLNWY
jgi:hypothetical protein